MTAPDSGDSNAAATMQLTSSRWRTYRFAPLALAAWAACIVAAIFVGRRLVRDGLNLVMPTPPVLGKYVDPTAWIALPLLVGALAVAFLPTLVQHMRVGWLLLTTWAGTLAWSVAVALGEGEGWSALTRGPSWWTEYLVDTPRIAPAPGEFLRTFVDNIATFEIHTRAHPPGFPLVLAFMDRMGLTGPWGEAVLVLIVGSTTSVAVVLTVRRLGGDTMARRVVPFAVLSPAAIWMATSADAAFAGVAAWCVALFVYAVTTSGRRSILFGAAAGVVGGLTIMLSYGLVLIGVIPLLTVLTLKCWKPVVPAILGALSVVAVFAALGFWWLDGLRATINEYHTLDIERPYWYFAFANLAAFGIALGPAVLVALTQKAPSKVWIVAWGGLLAAAIAHISGLSEGEVERIWLPFTVWATAATAVFHRPARLLLTVQVATPIIVISFIQTQW